MIPSIARQSVIIKCNQQASVLLGNYEFYYVAGVIEKLFSFGMNEEMQPENLLEIIYEKMDGVVPKDEREKYLFTLVKNFKPSKEVDEQMKELFRWGATEEKLWEIHVK